MWLAVVYEAFEVIGHNAAKNKFYGPFNKLLNILFPCSSPFTVHPQYTLGSTQQCADFIITYGQNGPVLVIEVKPPHNYLHIANRAAADIQVRTHMHTMAASCALETLYSISAIGTQLTFYTLDTGNINADISPPPITCHPTQVNDTATASCWHRDVLCCSREMALCGIAMAISNACTTLYG
ncbi:hypothetical protein BKA82DRAFT_129836 [Pisolithus tinctorius]|uniref:Fungal-type protein kinase domain-containing protein n=1 Tax=Pisolithus tinctorius Marx 270 TaxID=870435 RepID=A0A0C3PPC3_PISTI|nr:hypothetical protein BKA82DRAFT_129836 [Pisolithus tinctorius]KIO10309.1 hypothetical protein M404DRAFT_129836 [Pisolithus tinctorius Marx 270]